MGSFIRFQDTAGSERYEAMSRIYYRGARAAIVCYDLTDRTSFERTRFWVNELKNSEEVSEVSPRAHNDFAGTRERWA